MSTKSRLTWDYVLFFLRNSGGRIVSNQEIAEALGASVHRVTTLTLIMWEAGAIDRVSLVPRKTCGSPIGYFIREHQ